jgi:hypothetical protein
MIMDIAKSVGLSTDIAYASEGMCIGSSAYIRDRIQRLHEETGINYFVFLLRRDQFKEYAETIVQPLVHNR